ncbi:MAG: formyltransferase family protein, partial [Actinomycetota bacterium]|nr:formyltransferase family protein [Actinomycetota bacterium]
MRVLLLGPERARLGEAIRARGDEVVRTEERIAVGDPALDGADFLISFGYRHIIPAAMLEPFGPRAINLHISLLPWNRGADPNLWSYLEDTPKGVTIHVLDEGLDTGPIVAQREVADDSDDTLRTSYERLTCEIIGLF